MTVTLDRLKELLDYDPKTGLFTWRHRADGKQNVNTRYEGKVAGHIDEAQYRFVRIDGVLYRAGRLAWFYCHGSWPVPEVDHWDQNPLNDRIGNLREADRPNNEINKQKYKGWTSAYKGVSRCKEKFRARLATAHIGVFNSEESAAKAYDDAVRMKYGQYASLNFPVSP